MTLLDYYIRYLTQLSEGGMAAPDELTLHGQSPEERVMELQKQVAAMGIPEFVRLCAKTAGEDIPQNLYDEFDQDALLETFRALQQTSEPDAGQTPAPEPVEAEQSPAPRQNAYEAFLDCMSLEDSLLDYLIEVLKADDGLAFFRLSQVAVRKELKLADFLYWFATKELYADEAERACVTIMDAGFDRLAQEGEKELLAALLSGDKTTFQLYRCQAPELQQLPAATYEWYETYYLDRYYPIRYMMKFRGVPFPAFSLEAQL